MMAKSHMMMGALAGAVFIPPVATVSGYDLPPLHYVVGIGLSTAASLLPDLDHPDSLITKGKLKKSAPAAAKLAVGFLAAPARAVGMASRALGQHRGFTHSLLMLTVWSVLIVPLYALAFAGALLLFGGVVDMAAELLRLDIDGLTGGAISAIPTWLLPVGACVAIGYGSHLVADGCTISPQLMLWPLPRPCWILPAFLRFRTGSGTEQAVGAAAGVLLFVVVLWNLDLIGNLF